MNWFKTLTSYIVVAQIVLVPALSHAQNTDGNTATLTKYAKVSDYDSRLDLQGKKMLLIDRSTRKVAIEIPLRDNKTLTQYSPKALNQKIAAELMKAKIANSAAWSHAVKSFPTESAMFFVALGGMVAVQLFTDYANNPVGMKQHIDHQLSPVGQIGFFMFMYSQGVTSNALNLWLKRPNLAMPIGMLGMTVGLAVQTYFSQVATDPHIRACAASFFKGETPESDSHPCEDAYKYLVLDKKILEGPGVASLLGTFLISVGGKAALGATLRLIGFEIGMWVAPGGLAMKFGRLLVNSANIAAFTVIQMKLEHMIGYAWKNYFDGNEFVTFNDSFVAAIEAQKRSQWKSKSSEMAKDLREFSKKMSEWRVNNLSEAYMANQAWSEFLMNLTSMYNASYNFYSTYVDQLNSQNSLVDRAYPLNGVTAKGLNAGHEDLYLVRPERIELLQAETTLDVAAKVADRIRGGYYKSLGFNREQLNAVLRIQTGLASEDVNTKGRSILELNNLIRKYSMITVGSPLFSRELQMIHGLLGQPKPLFEKGRGFAASMLLSPNTMSVYKDLQLDSVNGRFATPDVTDYFVVQMICGPEIARREKVITMLKGFPAQFRPPALTLDDGNKDDLCSSAGQPIAKERIYNLPFSGYKTAPEYLRAKMDPEVAKDFITWWEKGTEAPLKEAFKGFAASYKEVVAKLYKGLNNTQNSSWNRGFISNGALLAAFQELRLYSLILGELLKDSYKTQNKIEIPNIYLNATIDPKITMSAADYAKSKKPLLALLGRASRYDFNTLLSMQPNADSRSLKIQKKLENQFAIMNGLIQKAQKQSVKSETFQNQMKAVEATLSEFSSLFGINKDNPGPGLVTLNEDQKTLAVTCLELLQSISQELAMYGNMAGTASYPEAK